MKKYVLSLFVIALSMTYILPARAVDITVNNHADSDLDAGVRLYLKDHVDDRGFTVQKGMGIGWTGADWVQLRSLYLINADKPVKSCQGVDFNTSYYSDVTVTIHEDGTCTAVVGKARS